MCKSWDFILPNETFLYSLSGNPGVSQDTLGQFIRRRAHLYVLDVSDGDDHQVTLRLHYELVAFQGLPHVTCDGGRVLARLFGILQNDPGTVHEVDHRFY